MKYTRARHIPLPAVEGQALEKEELSEFVEELADAGKTLKRLRESSGLSQTELAEKIGLEASLLEKIELGEQLMSQETAKRLGELFSVDYQIFL